MAGCNTLGHFAKDWIRACERGDVSQLTGAPQEFTYSLDRSKGSAGDALHLTITGSAPAQQGRGFLLYSSVGKLANLWPVLVTN